MKIQSYADDNTIIAKHISDINKIFLNYKLYSKASNAQLNEEKN